MNITDIKKSLTENGVIVHEDMQYISEIRIIETDKRIKVYAYGFIMHPYKSDEEKIKELIRYIKEYKKHRNCSIYRFSERLYSNPITFISHQTYHINIASW